MINAVRLKTVVGVLLLLTLCCGCGYGPIVVRGPLAEGRGVNVVMFANKSYRPGVSGVLTRQLVDVLALRTGGRVLSGDEAPLEMTGTVISYGSQPISYTANDTIMEYKSVVSVQGVLSEKRTQKVLWKGELTEEQSFPMNAEIAKQQNAEDAAIEKVCRRLAQEIWQKIGEQF